MQKYKIISEQMFDPVSDYNIIYIRSQNFQLNLCNIPSTHKRTDSLFDQNPIDTFLVSKSVNLAQDGTDHLSV